MPQTFNPLIQTYEVSELARECGSEDSLILKAIEESELNDIRPAIGDIAYSSLKKDMEKYDLLLDGGEYDAPCGGVRMFVGLKTTLAYYTWARLAKTSPYNLTRFGFVVKNDDYSSRPEWSERQAAYNDAYSIADSYMRDCLEYIKAVGLFDDCCGGSVDQNTTRSFTRIIGD